MARRRQLQAAIVGAGLMGRWHAHAIRRSGHRVCAVFDADPERAQRLAARTGAKAVRTLDDALASADVVHICTPTVTHEAICRRALTAGKSVVCEKPLATSAALTSELHALGGSNGSLLVPVHQFTCQQGVRKAKRTLAEIAGGVHFQYTACTAGAHGRDAAGREQVALEVLPHPLSLFEFLAPGSLVDSEWHMARTAPGELVATGSARDVTMQILISCASRPTVNALGIRTSRCTVDVDLFHGFAQVDRRSTSRFAKLRSPFGRAASAVGHASANLLRRAVTGEVAYPGLQTLVSESYDTLLGKRESPPVSVPDSIAVAVAIDRLVSLRKSFVSASNQ